MIYAKTRAYELRHGKMQDELEKLPRESIDCIITDPPYELNFMGKGWDNSGVAFDKNTWAHCFNVLKDGGYLLAFGGSRTFHRIACAIEDAGFEIRDTIMWLYGSGFPKSMNVGLALDKKNGVDNRTGEIIKAQPKDACVTMNKYNLEYAERKAQNEWAGWGTALKPSYEPIIVARKPFKCSLVDNILANGVGGLNIDECRVAYKSDKDKDGARVGFKENSTYKDYTNVGKGFRSSPLKTNDGLSITGDDGRFPANTILTYDDTDFEEVCGGFPYSKSTGEARSRQAFGKGEKQIYNLCGAGARMKTDTTYACDEGSASRYFYCAKANKRDRDEGLDGFEEKTAGQRTGRKDGSAGINAYAGATCPAKNIHPTVKPVSLMQYLVRLVAPKGATILDPFMGSGSTGKAVMFENKDRDANYKFIGIEMTDEYLPICKARIDFACGEKQADEIIASKDGQQMSLEEFL